MTFVHAQSTDEVRELASLYALGALPAVDRIEFELHLRDCMACRTQVQEFAKVANQMAFAVSASPPASLRARILAQVPGERRPSMATEQRGVLFQQGGLLISRAKDLPWEPAAIPGVWSKTLWVDTARKYCTSLVRLDPGAVYPAHRHSDIEEVYMLEGDFLVEGVQMQPGDYCRSEPGSIHGESRTKSGVLLVVFSSQEDEVLA